MEDRNLNTKLQQLKERELKFLQNLRNVFLHAKDELNNDLTKLAIRNLPLMAQDSDIPDQLSESQTAQVATSSQPNPESDVQQLEPLDLDL